MACLFYSGNAVATIAWWIVLWKVPSSRVLFLGETFGAHWFWIVLPDGLAAVFGGLWVAVAVANRRKIAGPLAWVHFGAAGYAWALTLSLALFDPRCYWGLLAMSLTTSLSFAFAMRLNAARMLWGPFEFRPAKPGAPSDYRRQTAKQITAMWLIFLVAVPAVIAGFEVLVGWHANWLTESWRLPVALILFGSAASLGLTGPQ